MEAGGRAGGVEDERNRKVAAVAGAEEVVGGEGGVGESTMSAGALRSTVVDAFGVGAAVIGSAGIGPVVEEPADLAAIDSATVGGDGDAGASTLAGVAVGAAVIGTAGQASGEVSLVKPDMQKEEVGEGSKKRKLAEVALDQEAVEPVEPPYEEVEESDGSLEEVGEGSKKRKLAEVAPDQEVVEPVEPPYEEVEESDGSLEYDSQDSAESVDSRNVESFKRKLLEKLEDGKLPFKKHGHFFCPWHTVKPKGGMLLNLKQHAKELSITGTSKQVRAEHAALLQVLDAEGDA